MKKIMLIVCSIVVLVGVPAVSGAIGDPTPFPDAVDCSQLGLGATPVRLDSSSGRLDRVAICVTDGQSKNGAELYVGGALHPPKPTHGACSAIVVGGKTLEGNPDWIHVLPGNPVATGDEVLHDCK
jgi:hypothetical protein